MLDRVKRKQKVKLVKMDVVECPRCEHRYIPRSLNPRRCPHCFLYYDVPTIKRQAKNL